MKVRYIGSYPAEKSELVAYGGYVFRAGEVVEIDDKFAAKVRGNRFFEVVEDTAPSAPAVEPTEAPAPKRGRKPRA